jgi:hypothetical protein
MTDDILVIVDQAAWGQFKDYPLEAAKIEGFYHNLPKSPYRNVALGLKTVRETYPDADWYCYCEYDVLFGSSRFVHNLKMADEMGIWMLGNDGRREYMALPLIQAMVGEPFKKSYYLLGCCQFFGKKFMDKLFEISFFDKFLTMTNSFNDGFFPFYSGYDLSEHMYPTLAQHFGGNIGVFAHYDENRDWHGAYKFYPVRWNPELDPETENFPEASIMHPLKTIDHKLRVLHREKRKWNRNQSELFSTCPLDIQKMDNE